MKPHSKIFATPFGGTLRRFTHKSMLLVVLLSLHGVLFAQSGHKIIQPREGGLSGTPDLTSITISNLQTVISWNGFAGPYQVEGRTNLASGTWDPVGSSTMLKLLVSSNLSSMRFLRVRGGAPPYTGAETCQDCHGSTHANWSQTIHAGAFNTLKAIGQEKNPACIVCHSVGFGYPSGYTGETTTPQFANVQCENCHGPAANHAADPGNVSIRPVLTKSAMLCGGCHNGFHHPTYDEWTESGHANVDPAVKNYFLDSNTTNATARMKSCGACHSGASRLAMIKWGTKGTLELPTGQEAADTGITCVTCHDPHKPNLDSTHSLRNPRFSTNFFSYNTATSTTFTNQYNASVQVCAQCHNQRGAAVTDTSRPPHHSGQYNILIGDIGTSLNYAPATTEQSSHRQIVNQCTHCHTHQHPQDNPSEENPVYTGHNFAPDLRSCIDCHSATNQPPNAADVLLASTQADTKLRIQELKGLLDSWATTKAVPALRVKYGALAWEYNTPGTLSNPTGSTAIVGPTTTEQADVPLDIKKARMYLYLLEYDGSYGVHNARYARFLLNTAKANVQTLLNAP